MIPNPLVARREAIGGLFAAGLVLSGCTGKAKGDVLRVGSQKGGTKALLTASGALDGAPYAVEWAEFPAAQHLLEALAGGAIDLGGAGDAPFLFAYLSGGGIRAVGASTAIERPVDALAIVVPGASPVKGVADLRGKRIATTRGSVGHYLVLQALEDAKLPADAVTFTWLAPGDAKAAFSSGSIDAWSTWVPYLTTAINEGGRVIADGSGRVSGYAFEAANLQAIESKRPLIADFLQREAKALRWAKDHQQDYAKVLAADTGLPADIALAMVTKLGRTAVPIDDKVIAEQRSILALFERAGAVSAKRPLEDGYDKSFARDV